MRGDETQSPTIELKVLDARLREWGLPRYQSSMAAAVDLHACLPSRAGLGRSRARSGRVPLPHSKRRSA